jgi:hypothetical protein
VSAEEGFIVNDRIRITQAALKGPKGDVCPEPATIGTRLRHLGRTATSVTAAVFGGQDGRQAFAVGREVPT